MSIKDETYDVVRIAGVAVRNDGTLPIDEKFSSFYGSTITQKDRVAEYISDFMNGNRLMISKDSEPIDWFGWFRRSFEKISNNFDLSPKEAVDSLIQTILDKIKEEKDWKIVLVHERRVDFMFLLRNSMFPDFVDRVFPKRDQDFRSACAVEFNSRENLFARKNVGLLIETLGFEITRCEACPQKRWIIENLCNCCVELDDHEGLDHEFNPLGCGCRGAKDVIWVYKKME